MDNGQLLPLGFPTHTKDINGDVICLGDIVDYAFEGDDPCPFEVIFENNAFRKKYKNWDIRLTKPLLEFGYEAEKMRLKIVTRAIHSKKSNRKNEKPYCAKGRLIGPDCINQCESCKQQSK